LKIVCPMCNTSYNIPSSKIPQGKRAVATCKKCGGRIVIEPGGEIKPDFSAQIEPASKPTISSTPEQPPYPTTETGEFQFLAEVNGFKGYAGFWKRFFAAIFDGCILTVAGFIIAGFIGFVYGFSTGASEGAGALGNTAGIILGWLYFSLMESSSKQGTLGKMALGIKVTDLSGNAISFAKATGRHFSKIISTIILLVGYLMVAFTAKKQGLHDMITGCLVVNRR
jgi:predicted Zn finger-like uncharacterized protein